MAYVSSHFPIRTISRLVNRESEIMGQIRVLQFHCSGKIHYIASPFLCNPDSHIGKRWTDLSCTLRSWISAYQYTRLKRAAERPNRTAGAAQICRSLEGQSKSQRRKGVSTDIRGNTGGLCLSFKNVLEVNDHNKPRQRPISSLLER